MPIDARNVLCAQLTRDLFAIAKFMLPLCNTLTHFFLVTFCIGLSEFKFAYNYETYQTRISFFERYVRRLMYSILAYAYPRAMPMLCGFNVPVKGLTTRRCVWSRPGRGAAGGSVRVPRGRQSHAGGWGSRCRRTSRVLWRELTDHIISDSTLVSM